MICAQHSELDARTARWSILVVPGISMGVLAAIFKSAYPGAVVASSLFAFLLSLYYLWLLLCRIQCSLLELCMLMGALGNVGGWLLTIPGMATGPIMWPLLPIMAAWLCGSAVKSSIQCALLRIHSHSGRACMLLLNWWFAAAPALLLAGLLLYFGRMSAQILISENMAEYGLWMLLAGFVGTVLAVLVELKVCSAAQDILDFP